MPYKYSRKLRRCTAYLVGGSIDRSFDIAVDRNGNAFVTGFTTSNDFPNNGSQSYAGGQDTFITRIDTNGYWTDSTYLGGGANEFGNGIAVDSAGNAYITGDTTSSNFPVTASARQSTNAGMEDAFVTKLITDGSQLAYSTFLGGTSDDFGNAITVDSAGKIYVAGETGGGLPLANAKQPTYGGSVSDAFVAKIDPSLSGTASLIFNTFLGGMDLDQAFAIALDPNPSAMPNPSVYVTGRTYSADFPKTTGVVQPDCAGTSCGDAFVTSYTWNGTTLNYGYSTFLGGSAEDGGGGIAVDSAQNATVVGWTSSTDFPPANPVLVAPVQASNAGNDDVVVARLNASGSALLYRTYLGGTGNDDAGGVALDSQGSVYLSGLTESTDFPLSDPLQVTNQGGLGGQDAILAKIDPTIAGSFGLIYSTYLGGNGDESVTGIAIDSASSVYLAGWTYSTDFPTATPIRASAVGQEAFVTKLTNRGRVLRYTYDGLQRLIGADERPSSVYTYNHDLAGNRTSVQVNGGTPTTTTYNFANEITNAGYSYDNAGNLIADGTTTRGDQSPR